MSNLHIAETTGRPDSQQGVSVQIMSEIITHMKYARHNEEWQRRETFDEVVTRNREMQIRKYPDMRDEIINAYASVYNREVLPSMRSFQFGGTPIEMSPNRMFNCAFARADHWKIFPEAMFLLLGGSGLGYSVQLHHVARLPKIQQPSNRTKRFLVGDSIEGWADAVKALVKAYFFGGSTPVFDLSDIRPKGSKLITSGGKAPGPEPLRVCLAEIKKILSRKRDGEQLTSLEVHDIMCIIADAVLSGGIRRAALIALFSPEDNLMLNCKNSAIPTDGGLCVTNIYHTTAAGLEIDENRKSLAFAQNGVRYDDVIVYRDKNSGRFLDIDQFETTGTLGWWVANPQRGRANNSAIFVRDNTSRTLFNHFWNVVQNSGSGEPGIYWTNDPEGGTNPCVEIYLQDCGFCNLTTVNVSNVVDQEDLNRRARAAAFIGTLQAGYTDFHYLRDEWRRRAEDDALLGVSMTGIASGAVLSLDLKEAAAQVLQENERVAALIGINPAKRTTCIKPEGTASLVIGCSSGIHAWHAPYYVRRIRVGKNEAIYTYLQVYHPELIEDDSEKPLTQAVISVPVKAPESAIVRTESMPDMLNRIKRFNEEWVASGHREGLNTHNVSATISVKPTEWAELGEWVWNNRRSYNGISVLPFSEHTYKQAPFEDINVGEYERLLAPLKTVDLTKVVELDDLTNHTSQVACGGASCEIT